MSARQKATKLAKPGEHPVANEVRLVGRVSQAPAERVLPSGDVLWTVRVVVPRPKGAARGTVDALDCAAWTKRAQRAVASWGPGDVVEVTGAMRRRFFRTAQGAVSRVEVEVSRGRVIRRAGSG
ncbi:single-stranded DNA-binding protein [Nocardioides soli]|uniref:Single-strand DNA-binding protein n=1 Tax=Nocardioides soli TaxID=1036020 RepID=A0A7W4VZ71_9ACTN|nr:single-stranded DNA-binding protein [Nocardioides soli]MBB3044467.1 single-strand DNA-binding protein [Nocardioides soli]